MTSASDHDLLLGEIEDAIRRAVPEGEVVVHYNIVVQTRAGADARTIRLHRWSQRGSDPVLSLGLLTAAKAKLLKQLGLSD